MKNDIYVSYRNKFKKNEYFYKDFDKKCCKKGFNIFHCVYNKPSEKNILVRRQYSYIFDLDDFSSEKELYNLVNKDIRNSYNFCNNNFVKFKSFLINLDNFDLVYSMLNMLSQMYEQKHIKRSTNIQFYKGLAMNKNLLFTIALYNDEPIVFHVYLINNEDAVLFHSCSLFRGTNLNRNFIGKANRFLHFSDFLFFKNKNFKKYDWGGLFDKDGQNSIDLFKKSFPGKVIEYYHISMPKGICSKFVFLIKKILNRDS